MVEPSQPADLLVIGHVTQDHVVEGSRLGGAASYAALAAAALGRSVQLLTSAPDSHGILRALRDNPRIEIESVVSPSITSFEVRYRSTGRDLRLLSRASSLQPAHLPIAFDARAIYLAPVAREFGPEDFALPGRRVVVGAQGWLRQFDEEGTIEPAAPPKSVPRFKALILSESDHPDADLWAAELARLGHIMIVTRGGRGLTLYQIGDQRDFAPCAAQETHPTGAGDVFGAVFTLAMSDGAPIERAIGLGMEAAARSVEGPSIGRVAEWARSVRSVRA